MASVKLPWDLEEEILSRLPPRSLVRFRAVCKHWNALFNDKRFLNNHLGRARPQFIILTESKIYSIDINMGGVDPTIEMHELASDFPYQDIELLFAKIMACDGLLFRHFWKQGITVWNPWLRQLGWIEYEHKDFDLCGVGYDRSRPEKGHKILGYFDCMRRVSDLLQEGYRKYAIYECASRALKFIDTTDWALWSRYGECVSLNGNLYWIAINRETREYFIVSFDFSIEILKTISPAVWEEKFWRTMPTSPHGI